MAQRLKQATAAQAAHPEAEAVAVEQVSILSLMAEMAAQALVARYGLFSTSKTHRQAAALPVMV